jgi:hypothetical protein
MYQFIFNNKPAFTIYKGIKAIEMYYKVIKMHGLKTMISVIKNK